MRIRPLVALAAAASLPAGALVFAGVSDLATGADHLDAPGLSSPSARPDADITDIYAFQGADPGHTVLVLATGPASGAIAPNDYGHGIRYAMNIDQNGDALPDLAYVYTFGSGTGTGVGQRFTVTRYTGNQARYHQHGVVVARGTSGSATSTNDGGRVFAGLRSDPFFFDLTAFENDVLGVATNRHLCDANTTDFFAPLNVHAIVLELPDGRLGRHIGYYAATSGPGGRIDRMGRPAINTVFNKGADKNRFNSRNPFYDSAFTNRVTAVLDHFSALDGEGAYTPAQEKTLAGVLLPDLLTYDTSTPAAGPLNGRALADDVVDAELNIVTGGYPFPGRDANGAVGTDCVGPHRDYLAAFPYLGAPHGT